MCTVLFIPDKQTSILVSLRDEHTARPAASFPEFRKQGDTISLFPKDSSGGGTWVGANDNGNIIILLNGGFVRHERRESYARSRGLIVTELLSVDDPSEAWMQCDLTDIEPHTLVILQNKQLFQMVWDGDTKHKIEKSTVNPHIWSSSTLYNEVAAKQRENWFHKFFSSMENMDASSLLDFFQQHGNDNTGFIINRNETIKTLSMTYLVADAHQVSLHYQDFVSGEASEQLLPIKNQ